MRKHALSPARLLALVPALLLASPVSQTAGDEQTEKVRVARLVKLLGSERYDEREMADRQLSELGPAGREQLAHALHAQDTEVRLRAEQLLKRLQTSALWAPSYVDLRAETEPVARVLARLGEQSGNHIRVGQGYSNFNSTKVQLTGQQKTFWEAVDEVCRQSQNHVRPHYNPRQPGLVLVAGALQKNPLSYGGPLRLQLTSARREFIEQFDYDEHASDVTHKFQINLQAMWESRFRLVAYRGQPEVVEAVTDTGETLEPTESAGSGWNLVGSGMQQITASLRLQPPPVAARRLDRLTLRWGLLALGDFATIELDGIAGPRTHYADDVELAIQNVSQRKAGRYAITVLVSRDLVVPEPQEVLLHENRIELFDAQGRAFVGSIRNKSLLARGVRLEMTFQAPAPRAKPHVLRLTYPKIRSERDVEVVFHNVPLPGEKPQ